MDILIPLGRGSSWQNNELRYALRSVEKHLSGYDNIFIVGEKPDWIQNITHIPFEDKPGYGNRDRNIFNKILAGIKDERLSYEFMFMSDDHFFTADFSATRFPYYYRCNLQDSIESIKGTPYANTLTNTYTFLRSKRAPVKDFNLHCPVVYHTMNFMDVFLDMKWPEYGYAIKSVYCNMNVIAGVEYPDLKFSQPLMKESIYQALEDRLFFSVGNRCLKGDMKEVLQELYPIKSKYEI